jgi:peptidoglycan/LPS O-acetylase OafA/YrhL
MTTQQLTFTRFIAALLVVLFHYAKNRVPFQNNWSSSLIYGGWNGVAFFFVLSGFVMIVAYYPKKDFSTPEFFKRRVARVYPMYLLALALSCLVFIKRGYFPWLNLWLETLAIQTWFPGMAINKPGWSIPVEFFFYLSFPVLLKHLYRQKNLLTGFVFALAVWLISHLALDYFYTFAPKIEAGRKYVSFFPLGHWYFFLFGNITGLIYLRLRLKWSRNFGAAIIALTFLAYFLHREDYLAFNTFKHLIFSVIILTLALDTGNISKVFRTKVFITLGNLSYSLYILQYPVFKISCYGLLSIGVQSETVIVYVSLAVLILLSALAYKFIESPLRDKINERKLTANVLKN